MLLLLGVKKLSFKRLDFIHINSCYHKIFVIGKGWNWFQDKVWKPFLKGTATKWMVGGTEQTESWINLKTIFKIFSSLFKKKKKNQWNGLKITCFPGILLQFRGVKKKNTVPFVHKTYVCDTIPMMKKKIFKKMHMCKENSPSLLLVLHLACSFKTDKLLKSTQEQVKQESIIYNIRDRR